MTKPYTPPLAFIPWLSIRQRYLAKAYLALFRTRTALAAAYLRFWASCLRLAVCRLVAS